MKNRVKISPDNLSVVLQRSGMKKQDVAAKVGVTRESFSRWLSGRVEYIDEKKVILLSEVFQCAPSFISPELPPDTGNSNSIDTNKVVSCESFIRLGIFSGQWTEILNLYGTNKFENIVENSGTSVKLFESLRNIFYIKKFRSIIKKNTINEEYELFETGAQLAFANGINELLELEFNKAEKLFLKALIQSQTEWILAASYLALSYCQYQLGDLDLSIESMNDGIESFRSSHSVLTGFFVSNLILFRCYVFAESKPRESKVDLEEAQEKMKAIGLPFGALRCDFYRLFLTSFEGSSNLKILLSEDIVRKIRHLPPAIKLEILVLCKKAAENIGEHEFTSNFENLIKSLLPSGFLKYFYKENL